jgi:hypothetical protein
MPAFALEGRRIFGRTVTRSLDEQHIQRNSFEKSIDKLFDKLYGTHIHEAKKHLDSMLHEKLDYKKTEAFMKIKALAPEHFQDHFLIEGQETTVANSSVTLKIKLNNEESISTEVSLAASFWPEVSEHLISKPDYNDLIADLSKLDMLSKYKRCGIDLNLQEQYTLKELSDQYDVHDNVLHSAIYRLIPSIDYYTNRDKFASVQLNRTFDSRIGLLNQYESAMILKELIVDQKEPIMERIERLMNDRTGRAPFNRSQSLLV